MPLFKNNRVTQSKPPRQFHKTMLTHFKSSSPPAIIIQKKENKRTQKQYPLAKKQNTNRWAKQNTVSLHPKLALRSTGITKQAAEKVRVGIFTYFLEYRHLLHFVRTQECVGIWMLRIAVGFRTDNSRVIGFLSQKNGRRNATVEFRLWTGADWIWRSWRWKTWSEELRRCRVVKFFIKSRDLFLAYSLQCTSIEIQFEILHYDRVNQGWVYKNLSPFF